MTKTSKKSNIAQRRETARESGDQEYQQRREQLLCVAGKIFREKGYDGASMNDFAKAIGIDRASIYYYISGKEELFQAIVYEAVRANVLMIEAIRDGDDAPPDKVRKLIIGLMKSYETHYPYLYVYVQEDMARISASSTAWAREMRKLSKRFDEATLDIVEQGIREGTIDAKGASAQMVAFAIVGMCNWSHRWFRPSGRISAEVIGQQFADVVLGGILAGGRAAGA